jgi:putative inorganic carbon (hco3(-)) transporter
LSVCALFIYFTSSSKKSPLFGPILFFFGILTLYTFISYNFAYSWNVYFNRVVKFSMLAVFLSVFVRTSWALKMVIGAFLLAMIKLGQEGFVGWLTGSLVWENQGILRLHGSVPIYEHPNSFSGMAIGCLPFIYYLYPVVSKWWKVCLFLLFIFCAIIIVYTGSRTGYVASLGLLGIFFFMKKQGGARWRYLLLVAAISVAALVVTPSQYSERFESIFTQREKEGASSEKRIEIINDAVAVYFENPFGVGVGAFPFVRMQMFGRSQDTHNLYLELLTNLGPLGLIAFFVLVRQVFVANREVQMQLKTIQSDEKSFILAISQAIVAFIYARLFLGLFGMDTYEIYWWFAVGITVALWSIVQELQQNPVDNAFGKPVVRKG